MSTIPLTPAQHAILDKAIHHSGGRIDWFPDNIKGGARKKVLDGLFKRALITTDGSNWFAAAEAYDALGLPRPGNPKPLPELDKELDEAITEAESRWQQEAKPAPRTRPNSKQAEVLRMLQRPEGASIRQMCEATGWQAHTVRGALAGTFKKKLGLNISSDKPQGGERVYRVA